MIGETYQIGEHTVSLRPPASLAVRWEILAAAHTSGIRASAAALAACWDGPGRPSARYSAHAYSVPLFGGAVLEELLTRGVSFVQITEAGAAALGVLADGLVTADEVSDAEDFSVPDGEESTG